MPRPPRPVSAVASWLAAAALLAAAAPARAGGDGRLNPEPDEYYALYCASDLLEVWRSTPANLLLSTVPIASILALAQGGVLPLLDGMSVQRSTADAVTVSGSNGNAAPLAGTKTFSLSECIARNGGVPELPDPDPEPPSEQELLCREECQLCIPCLLEPCVESPVLPGFDLFCFADQLGCPVLCMDVCDPLPAPGGGGKAAARAKKPPDPAESGRELLYAVRNRVLAASPAGVHYRDLFYEHHAEILRLLVANYGRWDEARALLVRFQPHLLALALGRGADVTVSAADVAAVEAFLDHLASPASPALAADLAAERTQAQLAQLAGRTLEEARRILLGAASCPDAPDPACTGGFAKGSLVVDERKPGREKLVAKLAGGPALAQADFGDPTAAGPGDVSLCVYDDAGSLAAALGVARHGQSCGKKPCWKALGGAPPGGRGFAYEDKEALADGVRALALRGGAAGRSKLGVRAGNQASRRRTRLPDAIAPALAQATSVTVQLRTEAGCFSVALGDVTLQGPDAFKAR